MRDWGVSCPLGYSMYIYGWSNEGGEKGMGRRGVSFLDDGRERRLPGLLYADELVLCGELKEDLRVMVGWFA